MSKQMNGNQSRIRHISPLINKLKLKIEHILSNIQKLHTQAIQTSPRYSYICQKSKPILIHIYKLLHFILLELQSIINDIIFKTTYLHKLYLLFIIIIYYTSYYYYIQVPIIQYENEWHEWELSRQHSVSDLIPSKLDVSEMNSIQLDSSWNEKILLEFPYLIDLESSDSDSVRRSASEYIVPIPNYELVSITRGKLAKRLRKHAIQSCQESQQQHYENENDRPKQQKHSIPVIGITVANDTPTNEYLRRLLHTIDLDIVGSIVITWYDEQTEAQLVGKQESSLSHDVVEKTLKEYIERKGFKEISWRDDEVVDDNGQEEESLVQLADFKSLKVLSRITTSIQQFCIYDTTSQDIHQNKKCRNELVILRYSTNLGCSSGVNNPLFTHPTAPYWLIANYDIAYPPKVLQTMATELQKTKHHKPNLAVHTYGYIYGRGQIENPWSNFIITSCAVANVGVWDENIFPAYYEDDDYRDRIRYILGKWNDVIGDPDVYNDIPQHFMNDTHLIRYQTDRNVSVVHGPLNASTYLSGTHETLQKVRDEEKAYANKSYWELFWMWLLRSKANKPNSPYHYESQRWSLAKEVSNGEGFFRCKHGSIPDPGKHGEDSIRYFGWHERFLVPFVNRTRVTRLQEAMSISNTTSLVGKGLSSGGSSSYSSPWAAWTFNSTRRRCVHNALNVLLTMPDSKERENLTQYFKDSCSVC